MHAKQRLHTIAGAVHPMAVAGPFCKIIKRQEILYMKKFVKKHWLLISGMLIGAAAGYGYWKFVGCSSETCPITSRPFTSTIYGAVIGGLVYSLFQKNKRKKIQEQK